MLTLDITTIRHAVWYDLVSKNYRMAFEKKKEVICFFSPHLLSLIFIFQALERRRNPARNTTNFPHVYTYRVYCVYVLRSFLPFADRWPY